MQHFVRTVIIPHLIRSGSRQLCEIGASVGTTTDTLLTLHSIEITVVDPCFDADLRRKYRKNRRLHVYKGRSLDVLPRLSQNFDCILIDGDHNWYTVYNELRIIEQKRLLREGGTIFLHDVCWPYGRRDMYYRPKLIPARFRRRCEKKGIMYGRSMLSDASELNADLFNAVLEGGARNGVLTAIEDFLSASKIAYKFFCIQEEFGLGVLFKPRPRTNNPVFETLLHRARARSVVTPLYARRRNYRSHAENQKSV